MSQSRGLAHLVVFRVEGDRYAIRSDHVDRVLERTVIQPLPWLPRTIAGVLRHDEQWLPVVDPGAALNAARTAHIRPTVLVLRRAGVRYGIGVDEAMGRREVRAHRLQQGGAASTVTRFEDLEGALVLSDEDGLITLLDPDRLFKAEAAQAVEQGQREWSEAGTASIVSFRVRGANLGLHVGQVSEVLPWVEPEAMKSEHAFVLGSTTLREERIPLLDLARLFGLEAIDEPSLHGEDCRILVVEIGGERYGLVVDEVRDVERIAAHAITSAPRFIRRVAHDVVDAIADSDHGLLLLIRLDLLLTVANGRATGKPAKRRRSRKKS